MRKLPLDDVTVEKILSGTLHPDDAPPGYAGVASLLRAASTALVRTDPTQDLKTIAAMATAVSATPGGFQPAPRRPKRSRFLGGKLVAASVTGLLLIGTGLAFAGDLPGPAQNAAHTILAKVGINVPGHGPDVSGPALYGLCKAYASGRGGTSGQKNDAVALQKLQKAAQDAGQTVDQFCVGATPGQNAGHPVVPTPNRGGTGTADHASNGASEHGTGKANEHSRGHSQAGSDNRGPP
jgi:hypothetical protein